MADRRWTRSAAWCWPKSWGARPSPRLLHGPRSHRHGLGPSLQRRQRSAEGQMDAAHHFRRGHHRRRGDRAGCRLRRERHPQLPRSAMATATFCEAVGAKIFITNGVYGDLIAWRRSRPIRPAEPSVTMFLVEKGTPGFNVTHALDKHGWRSSDTAELRSRTAASSRKSARRRSGFRAIMRNFQNERTVIGAVSGRGAGALDYVRTRKSAPRSGRKMRSIAVGDAGKQGRSRPSAGAAAWLDTQGIDATKEVSMVDCAASWSTK